MLLKIISVVTFIHGAAVLFLCEHMKSNLPSSAVGLDAKAVETLLVVLRGLESVAIPWLSIYLIMLSIVMWYVSHKKHK
jgi:hypothetical protein